MIAVFGIFKYSPRYFDYLTRGGALSSDFLVFNIKDRFRVNWLVVVWG